MPGEPEPAAAEEESDDELPVGELDAASEEAIANRARRVETFGASC